MTLTAGLDTDLAVAKACGFPTRVIGNDVHRLDLNAPYGAQLPVFSPSRDLNDAVLAGMKCRLWNHHRICYDAHHGAVWSVYNEDDCGFVSDTSLPVAICAAILKLSKQRHS